MADKEKLEKSKEGLGISGFTLSIIGIMLAGWYGLIVSGVSFMFCFVQERKHKNNLGRAGLIISVIGLVLSTVWIILIYTGALDSVLNALPAA